MMEDTYRGFSLVDGLQHCPKIIVCDGYVTTKGKPHYKKGKITVDDALRYVDFIKIIRGMAKKGDDGPLPNTNVLELTRRTGFAHGVRAALGQVTTKFVLIVQVRCLFFIDIAFPSSYWRSCPRFCSTTSYLFGNLI
jgi:hypothetical protein